MNEILKLYCNEYPDLEISDVFKYIYQSVFGCEHLIDSNVQSVYQRLIDEYEDISNKGLINCKNKLVEPLMGDYCRVYLSAMNAGLTPKTLFILFLLSASENKGTINDLYTYLDDFIELCIHNEVPFKADDVKNKINQWEEAGFKPIHHSSIYNKLYHPAYRVIHKKYACLLDTLIELDKYTQSI